MRTGESVGAADDDDDAVVDGDVTGLGAMLVLAALDSVGEGEGVGVGVDVGGVGTGVVVVAGVPVALPAVQVPYRG